MSTGILSCIDDLRFFKRIVFGNLEDGVKDGRGGQERERVGHKARFGR